jgi:predicted kinase
MPAPIVLVAGPASAGKSTTSRALAATFERGVHVPVDDLRAMVIAGAAPPAPGWGDEVQRQVALARAAAVAMARSYAAAGFAVVIDDFFDPLGMREYAALLASGEARAVLLLPSADEARRRNLAREGGPDPTAERAIGHAYGFLPPRLERLRAEGWLVLDTTVLDAAATVAAIRAWLAASGG